MPRLRTVIDAEGARQRDLLTLTEKQLGRVPNLYRTMAASPAALQGYLDLRDALVHGRFGARLREQLALAVAAANGCDYCVAAHHARGTALRLDADELARNRAGGSGDARTAGMLRLVQRVVAERGRVTDDDLATARAAGLDDADIAEVVAHAALNTYANWFNHVAQPELDFPPAP
jgi:uncharacterized peroxidase-related enzyme